MRVRVDSKGRASASIMPSQSGSAVPGRAVPCILSQINNATFPEGDRGIVVTHALHFD